MPAIVHYISRFSLDLLILNTKHEYESERTRIVDCDYLDWYVRRKQVYDHNLKYFVITIFVIIYTKHIGDTRGTRYDSL